MYVYVSAEQSRQNNSQYQDEWIVSRDLCSVRYLSIGGADRGGVPSQDGDRKPLEKELSFSGVPGNICDASAQRPQKFATFIADRSKGLKGQRDESMCGWNGSVLGMLRSGSMLSGWASKSGCAWQVWRCQRVIYGGIPGQAPTWGPRYHGDTVWSSAISGCQLSWLLDWRNVAAGQGPVDNVVQHTVPRQPACAVNTRESVSAQLVHQRATSACVRSADLAAQAETNRNAEWVVVNS